MAIPLDLAMLYRRQNYNFVTKCNQKKFIKSYQKKKKNYWTIISYRTFVDKMYDIFVTPFAQLNPVFLMSIMSVKSCLSIFIIAL